MPLVLPPACLQGRFDLRWSLPALCCCKEDLGKASGSLRPLQVEGWGHLDPRHQRLSFSTFDSQRPAQKGHWAPDYPQVSMPGFSRHVCLCKMSQSMETLGPSREKVYERCAFSDLT